MSEDVKKLPYEILLPHCALGFSNLFGKLVKYASTYLRYILKRSANDLFNGIYAVICIFLSSDFLNESMFWVLKSMQFKRVPTTYAFIKKKTKNTLAVI